MQKKNLTPPFFQKNKKNMKKKICQFFAYIDQTPGLFFIFSENGTISGTETRKNAFELGVENPGDPLVFSKI